MLLYNILSALMNYFPKHSEHRNFNINIQIGPKFKNNKVQNTTNQKLKLNEKTKLNYSLKF